MPGISASRIGIGFNRGGFSWSSYWTTLISATVENAAPTHVVLTFAAANTSVTADDFAVTGFTVASGSWTGAVFTLVLSEAVLIFDKDLTITFKSTNTGIVTNNVADDGNTVAWYDSSNLSTITKDANELVSRLNDGLGSGNDLLQANAAKMPLYTESGILFNGTDEYLKAAFAYEQPEMIYLTIKQVTWTATRTLMDGASINTGKLQQTTSTPTLRLYAGAALTPNNDLAVNTWGIIKVLFDGANSFLQVDSNVPLSGNAGTSDMGGVTFGDNGAATGGEASNLLLYEAILRSASDDVAKRAQIDSYMQRHSGFFLI